MMPIAFLVGAILFAATLHPSAAEYKPDWASVDSRPVPVWFDECKLGIFSHWGVYSVPAYGSEWFWWYWKGSGDPNFEKFVEKHYPNGTTYADFAKLFTAVDLDTDQFASIVKASGACYFVLTSKHHEGFTLWPSATSWNWNSVDVGPHRDLVKDIGAAMRRQNIHFGVYFSLFAWFHPLYLSDIRTHRDDYVQTVMYPQMLELVNNYRPDLIWTDGDWEKPDTYWRSTEFLAWLYNQSPIKEKVAVNDRWGKDTIGKHGGYFTYSDHYDPGTLKPHKWENCLTLDRHSWGYRRDIKAADILTLGELIGQLARTISCGGNMLLNVGPDHTGRIVPIFEERLRQFGLWVGINQEAIYGSKAWVHQSDGADIWYTSQVRNASGLDPHRMFNPQDTFNTIIYAFLLNIPRSGAVNFPSIRTTDKTRVSILGTVLKVPLKKGAESLSISLSGIPFQDWPSTTALVFKVEFAASSQFNPLDALEDANSVGGGDSSSSSAEDNRIGDSSRRAPQRRRRPYNAKMLELVVAANGGEED